MKYAALTAAALLTATSIQAAEIGATGISIGASATTEYNVDAENMTLEVTPSMGYELWGTELSVSTDLMIYNDEYVFWDEHPTIDFKIDCFRHLRSMMLICTDLDHRETLFLMIGNA